MQAHSAGRDAFIQKLPDFVPAFSHHLKSLVRDGDLTRHIRERHHRYVREAIPRIQAPLEKVAEKHRERHPEISRIRTLFIEVGQEMIMHMQKEEQILFRYIDALEKAKITHGFVGAPFFLTVRNPIQAMISEHDSAGDLVKQIRKMSLDCKRVSSEVLAYQDYANWAWSVLPGRSPPFSNWRGSPRSQ